MYILEDCFWHQYKSYKSKDYKKIAEKFLEKCRKSCYKWYLAKSQVSDLYYTIEDWSLEDLNLLLEYEYWYQILPYNQL